MRILKDPEVRRAEILDTAERLFTTKGYGQTTIIDILNEIGIAKGTFYYYFKSKEEVMDAIITRIISADVAAAKRIAGDANTTAIDKLFKILFSQKPKSGGNKEKLTQQFHQPDNAEMHQKSLVQSISRLSPVLMQVLEQGTREKTMSADYPQETIELLLAAAEVIFDERLFHWNSEDAMRRVKAFIDMMESSLNAEKGSFDRMMDILM